jgi:hypothetical protein
VTVTLILAAISAIVVVLVAAEHIPSALAAFIRSCIPLVQALGEFHAALTHAFRHPAIPATPPSDQKSTTPRSPSERAEDSTATDAEETPGTEDSRCSR